MKMKTKSDKKKLKKNLKNKKILDKDIGRRF